MLRRRVEDAQKITFECNMFGSKKKKNFRVYIFDIVWWSLPFPAV